MIVRDETSALPGALEAVATLGDLVDRVLVHDTGSSDGTVALARAMGATVLEGTWEGDFALARNTVLDLVRTPWALVVDADERVDADPARLRSALVAALADDREGVAVPMVNIAPDGSEMYAAPSVRLLRAGRARYAGRVHERVVSLAGTPPRLLEVDAGVARVRHLGYTDAETVRRKAERNLELAGTELAAVAGGDDVDAFARALYHRGRTLVSAGRPADALADLQLLAGLETGCAERVWGLDTLAQLLLAIGVPDGVPELATELRHRGVDAHHCAWLTAQVLLAHEDWAGALPLLRSIDRLVDAVGRESSIVPVLEAQLVAAGRVGELDEAAAVAIRLLAGFGRTADLGSLLLTLWGDRPDEWLVELLAEADRGHAAAVVREFAGCGARGAAVAEALAVRCRVESGGTAQPQPAMSNAAPSDAS